MKYSHIIDEMTWSYSRITAYEDCPYRFYLKYIKKIKGVRHFFSDYGSFMHLIIQKFLTGELKKSELVGYYLTNAYATIERGELFIFAAEAKQGKSMMLLNCAVDLLKRDVAVLYIDSELNSRMFTCRLISHLTGIEFSRLKGLQPKVFSS